MRRSLKTSLTIYLPTVVPAQPAYPCIIHGTLGTAAGHEITVSGATTTAAQGAAPLRAHRTTVYKTLCVKQLPPPPPSPSPPQFQISSAGYVVLSGAHMNHFTIERVPVCVVSVGWRLHSPYNRYFSF